MLTPDAGEIPLIDNTSEIPVTNKAACENLPFYLASRFKVTAGSGLRWRQLSGSTWRKK